LNTYLLADGMDTIQFFDCSI